jgi:hypothetical protein
MKIGSRADRPARVGVRVSTTAKKKKKKKSKKEKDTVRKGLSEAMGMGKIATRRKPPAHALPTPPFQKENASLLGYTNGENPFYPSKKKIFFL